MSNTSSTPVTPPPALCLSLPDRVSAWTDGSLDPREWADQDYEWFRYADARYRASVVSRHPQHPIAPIRVAVKDTVDVAGLPTRLGLRHYRHYPLRSAAVSMPFRWTWLISP
jgi:hypothetical protein